jgi:hypothetical protein
MDRLKHFNNFDFADIRRRAFCTLRILSQKLPCLTYGVQSSTVSVIPRVPENRHLIFLAISHLNFARQKRLISLIGQNGAKVMTVATAISV